VYALVDELNAAVDALMRDLLSEDGRW
jgi:hypothetical protein